MIKKTGIIFFMLIIATGFVLLPLRARTISDDFSTTFESQMLPKTEIPVVLLAHPRLIIRSKPWGYGPSVVELLELSKENPFKSFLKNRPWNPKPGIEWAFRYLMTGDETLVLPIVSAMKKEEGYWPGRLYNLAILYDWLYNSDSFSEKDKVLVENKILRWAEKAIKMGEDYSTIWSHFAYKPVLDIAAAGLSLAGHRDEADKYIAMAGGYVKKNMFPGWQINDGAWQGGWTYYGQGCANLFRLIEIWSSATNDNLYELVQTRQGDWIRNHMYYLLYTMYPDNTPVDTCGFSYCSDQRGGTKTLLNLASAYKETDVLSYNPLRNKSGWRFGIWQYLYAAESNKEASGSGAPELPLTKLWGKDGVGYCQMRSGWYDGDTIIEYKCGDYFWSHQFQNQNAFTIYHKGRLAVQSGIYDGYWGNHMQFYYRPTVGSNTILVVQPDEKSWIPEELAKQFKIRNKNGFIKEYGGQRICYIYPKYGSAETCFTYDKYLFRKNNQHHFETGDIKAYEVTDRYSYIYGDATMAYNSPVFSFSANKPKLDLYERELVYIDKKYLIMFDRVRSLDKNYKKKWLLHSIGEPEISDTPVKIHAPGHREIFDAGVVRINHKGGTLFCKTMSPSDYLIEKIGGSAEVSPVAADHANKSQSTLDVNISEKYKRVSPVIATDHAVKEEWTIEFIDGNRFKVTGSETGEDGTGTLKEPFFLSKSQAVYIPKENWKGTPVKGDRFHFTVKSSSHRFWVDGKNYSPRVKSFIKTVKDGSHIDPGNWRIEVFPKDQKKFDTFLHFLYPCDRDKAVFPDVRDIFSSDGENQGIMTDGWVVLFNRKGATNNNLKYDLNNAGPISHLLLNMEPGSPYTIMTTSSNGQSAKKIRATEEGTVYFETNGAQEIEIKKL